MTASVSRFDRDFVIAHQELDAFFGKIYTYRRAISASTMVLIDVTLALMSHKVERSDKNGMTESWHGHVFIGTTAELVISGETFLPEQGDEIAEDQPDGSKEVFIVTKVPNRRCYDFPDPEQVKIIIFTKKIRTEPAP
jgi:hypothetical protein